MGTDSLHDTTVSVVSGDPGGSTEVISEDSGSLGEISSDKKVIRGVGSGLIRLEMDLACCSEKLVNMNLLMMHVAERESDFEAVASEKERDIAILAEKALEFDILSGVFDSEVKGMENFIGDLLTRTNNASEVISSHKHLGEVFLTLVEKLHDAKKSLKQSHEQVSELMMQSVKFQRVAMSFHRNEISDEDKDFAVAEDCSYFNTTAKLQMQTSEQQRHILGMLEKSLARELDLETQLTDCMQALDDMKRKLHSSRQVIVSAEEETAAVYVRFLEADNASSVLLGISKELISKLNLCQFNINSTLSRESQLNNKLQNCMQAIQKLEKEEAVLKDLAKKSSSEALVLNEKVNSLEEKLKASESMLTDRDASSNGSHEQREIEGLEEKVLVAESMAEKAEAECMLLSVTNNELNEELNRLKETCISHEKIDSLEKQLRETDIQLQQAMASIDASQEKQMMLCSSINDMEVVIEKLKSNVSTAEARAEKAESELNLLMEANKSYIEEFGFLKASSVSNEKVVCLEEQLRNTDIQLEQAMTSVEASEEKQIMLQASIKDMEILIEKLKSKVSAADARADSAEDKCIILSESHAELNEELNFLRGKVECLEESLQQAEDAKLAAAKDINIRTKVITDLVMQLAVEREHLQKQISMLKMDNAALTDNFQMANKASTNAMSREGTGTETGILSSEDHACSITNGKRSIDICSSTEAEKPPEDVLHGESNSDLEDSNSNLETVRTIDARLFSLKYVLFASLIAFIAVLATCYLSPENCPF